MNKKLFLCGLSVAAVVPAVIITVMAFAGNEGSFRTRPEGPCDVYAAGGAPCAAAHSTTRALSRSYDGPLYQIMRQSDRKTLDIGVVQPSAVDGGGYADAEAQDEFCKNTYCWITVIYDQTGNGNDLRQAPRGGWSGNSQGGFDNLPMADWAPVTVMGHKVYGVFINQGMGMRQNDTRCTAVDDMAQGQYWVINGHHFNNGCCFDYGNAEIDSHDDGDGTMETTYFGVLTGWYQGQGQGPWVMTDQENNLVGCVNEDPNDKFCPTIKSQTARFITAMVDGEPHHWRSMSGDSRQGELEILYDGGRIQNSRSSYDPMRKQGAILLGTGGDNGNGSAGTFYEGAMTAGGTFPSAETNQGVQANIVAAGYDVQRLSITASDKVGYPNGLQTFIPKTKRSTSVVFVNTTGTVINDLELSISAPRGWKAAVAGTGGKSRKLGYAVEPGQTVVVHFDVTSPRRTFNGDLTANASWTDLLGKRHETAVEKIRNVAPVKVNEFKINSADSFIELYNAGTGKVDISGWEIKTHSIQMPIVSAINIPARTKIGPGEFYLLALSTSGLSADAAAGDDVIYVRTVDGISVGDEISVGGESRKVAGLIRPDTKPVINRFYGIPKGIPDGTTTVWQPLPDGPVITLPAGSTNIPVQNIDGFKAGDKMAIGYGTKYPTTSDCMVKYEVVTITEVGSQGNQSWLSADAKPGDTVIKVQSVDGIYVGEKIRLDIDSPGHGKETVTVKSVGTPSTFHPCWDISGPDTGTGIELEEPLKFFHSCNLPFSTSGTGISFEPATKFDHSSNEPVVALIYGIRLDRPLSKAHPTDEVVQNVSVCLNGDKPDQLYGGPVLMSEGGNITLRDRKGNVVDAVNYGHVVDPWLSEGYHAEPGIGKFGSYAPSPDNALISTGRFPDGADSDDNLKDFRRQISSRLFDDAHAGSCDISIYKEDGLRIGDTFYIGDEMVRAALYNGTRVETRTVPIYWWAEIKNYEVLDITLSSPLKRDYPAETVVTTGFPTPGLPNRY